jgi:hypothetical protein
MRPARVDASILVLGTPEHSAPFVDELRQAGFRVTVASTLSEVRDLLSSNRRPSLLVVDARVGNPWRVDALQRMTAMVRASPLPTLRIGGVATADGAAGDEAQVLPADATVATIVAAVKALHDPAAASHRLPRASSQPELAEA